MSDQDKPSKYQPFEVQHGRPTKYKPEMDEKIVNFAKTHMNTSCGVPCVTVDHMAEYMDVNDDTLYEWRKRYPSFADAFSRAKKIACNRFVDWGLQQLVLNRENHFSEKTYNTILRNKFGYTEKTLVKLPGILKEKSLSKKASLVTEALLEGKICVEDGERLMRTLLGELNVRNEDELRVEFESLKDLVEKMKGDK
jgi:hypothetical protein